MGKGLQALNRQQPPPPQQAAVNLPILVFNNVLVNANAFIAMDCRAMQNDGSIKVFLVNKNRITLTGEDAKSAHSQRYKLPFTAVAETILSPMAIVAIDSRSYVANAPDRRITIVMMDDVQFEFFEAEADVANQWILSSAGAARLLTS